MKIASAIIIALFVCAGVLLVSLLATNDFREALKTAAILISFGVALSVLVTIWPIKRG